jgi:hypothetical protein
MLTRLDPRPLEHNTLATITVSGRNSLHLRKCRVSLRKCSEAQTVTEPKAAISQWFAWSLPTQRSREAVIALAGTFREVSAESRITDKIK